MTAAQVGGCEWVEWSRMRRLFEAGVGGAEQPQVAQGADTSAPRSTWGYFTPALQA